MKIFMYIIILTACFAIRALAAGGGLQGLIADLDGKDEEKRLAAMRTLREMESKDAAPAAESLGRAAVDANPSVAMTAIRVLSTLGADAAPAAKSISSVVFNPTSPTPLVEAGLDALAAIGPAALDALPGLVKLLAKDAPAIQVKAARAIGAIGQKASSALPDVIDCFMAGPRRQGFREHYDWQRVMNPDFQAMFIGAMRSMGPDARATPVFIYALGNIYENDRAPENYKIRMNALKGIEELGKDADKAVPGLVEYLESLFVEKPRGTPALAGKKSVVDIELCKLLGRIGEEAMPATEVLQRIFDDKSFPAELRNAAWEAINAIDTRDDLEKMLDGDLPIKKL